MFAGYGEGQVDPGDIFDDQIGLPARLRLAHHEPGTLQRLGRLQDLIHGLESIVPHRLFVEICAFAVADLLYGVAQGETASVAAGRCRVAQIAAQRAPTPSNTATNRTAHPTNGTAINSTSSSVPTICAR